MLLNVGQAFPCRTDLDAYRIKLKPQDAANLVHKP